MDVTLRSEQWDNFVGSSHLSCMASFEEVPESGDTVEVTPLRVPFFEVCTPDGEWTWLKPPGYAAGTYEVSRRSYVLEDSETLRYLHLQPTEAGIVEASPKEAEAMIHKYSCPPHPYEEFYGDDFYPLDPILWVRNHFDNRHFNSNRRNRLVNAMRGSSIERFYQLLEQDTIEELAETRFINSMDLRRLKNELANNGFTVD